MAVVWQASGTLLGGLTTADVTPVNPAHQPDDILICVTANRVITNTCATPSGWTLLFGPVDETAWRSYVFWKRATTSSEANPLCDWTATSADKYAQVHCIRGATTTGNPFVGSAWTDGATNPAVATGVTTTAANQYVLTLGLQADNLAASMTSVTGTDPTTFTQRHYSVIATGADAGGFFFDATRATSGATGTVSHTFSAAPLHWGIMVAAVDAQPGPNIITVNQAIETDTPQPITVEPDWPTPVATYFVSSTAATASIATPSFTPSANELIVVKEIGETEATPVATNPTGGSLTFTRHQEINTLSNCYVVLWSATVGGSPSSMTITMDGPGSTVPNWSAIVERWPAGTTVGGTTITSGAQGTGAPLASLTTTAANSTITWALGDWNATAPGTPTYRDSAVEETIHNRSPSSYVAYYAYQGEATAGSHDFGMTSPAGQKWSAIGIEIKAPSVGGGPTTVTVNQVTETDTPQAITRIKNKSILQVTETDTTQVVSKRKQKTILQAAELDVSQPVTPDAANVVNAATETDTAQTITRRKVKVVNQVVETDAPQPIRRVHQRTLGQPTESDLATTVAKRKTKTLAQALETDSAFSIKIMGRVFQTTELDTAQPIKAIKRKTLGQPAELDTVTTILKRKIRTLGQPVETNTATIVIKPGNKIVVLAGELDTAQKIFAIKRKTLGQTSDSNIALLITPRRVRVKSVNVAQELDLPTTLRAIKRLTLGVIEEVNLARVVTARTELPPPPDGIIVSVVIKPITTNVIISEGNNVIQKIYQTDVVVSDIEITITL